MTADSSHQAAEPTARPTPAGAVFLPVVRNTEPVEGARVGWAVGDEGVLIRWRWPNAVQPKPDAYEVFRTDPGREDTLLGKAARVTDDASAVEILGGDWIWLQETYELASIADLHQFLDANPAVDLWLADQRHRVALVRGLGYLDTTCTAQHTSKAIVEYTCRVTGVVDGDTIYDLGEVEVIDQGFTPLEPPTVLEAVAIVDKSLTGASDWVSA